MTLVKRLAAVAAVGLVALSLVSCGKSVIKDVGDIDDAVGIYPKAIEKLIEKDFKHAVKDVGMATHPDKIMAFKKARMDADVKIARQFEQEVSSLRKSYTEMVNDKSLEHQNDVNETFTLIKLRGSEVAKEMVTQGKDGYTAYVLKVISAEKMKQLADQQSNSLTEFKATQAYKSLEERVAQEKAARAASGM